MKRCNESLLRTLCPSLFAKLFGQVFSAGWQGIGASVLGQLARCLVRGDLRRPGPLAESNGQKDQPGEEGRSERLAQSLRYSERTVNLEQPETVPDVAAFLALRTQLMQDGFIE